MMTCSQKSSSAFRLSPLSDSNAFRSGGSPSFPPPISVAATPSSIRVPCPTYQVDIDELTVAYPDMVNSGSLALVILGLVEDDSSLLLHIPGNIISYSIQDKTHEILKSFELVPGQERPLLSFEWFDAYQFSGLCLLQ
ncbi:hypothetical protein L6164_006944 [Bauhinia variegata]|uniref:Uncharacterized protein n=1 Tax=Bauhinia variegata TaxID=167791 RepID=A0ACB9PVF5_BAUVA|nr:hypothetical protein L6164_006944 [Bauhinia variegata]